MGVIETLIGSRPWQPPTFDQPMPMSESSFGKPIGTDRAGRKWYRTKWGEACELRVVDATRETLPNGPMIPLGEERFRTFASPVAPGSYQALMDRVARTPKPPAPDAPIDALGHLSLAEGTPQRAFGSIVGVRVIAPVEPARGPKRILDRLSKKGVTVKLSADGSSLVVSASGGRPGPGVIELVDAARPLLLADLQGRPLTCTVTGHKGKPPAAVTLALGGTAWCGECKP